MSGIITATLILHLYLPGCASLKEKRRRLKPLLIRLHREFNVSTAELGYNDVWQSALVGCAMLGNDAAHLQRALQTIGEWVEARWPDVVVTDEYIRLS
ncbi:MAG: DUF503 domain-containing protein [Anaerolineae bacterium]|nr:MAG: DUF503 domain-containing protein [Anaerolineae bacterium]